jgi:hypothetical protein
MKDEIQTAWIVVHWGRRMSRQVTIIFRAEGCVNGGGAEWEKGSGGEEETALTPVYSHCWVCSGRPLSQNGW